MLHLQTMKTDNFSYTEIEGGPRMSTIGDKLKKARNEKNLTQQEVAEKLHISRTTISSWENARTLPDINYLILLSEIYELSLDELIKGDQHMMNKIKEDTDVVKSNKKLIGIVILWSLFYAGIFLLTKLIGTPKLTDPFINSLFFLIAIGIGVFYLLKNRTHLFNKISTQLITKIIVITLVGIIVYSISTFLNQLINTEWQQKVIKVLATFIIAISGFQLFKQDKKTGK